MARSLYVRSEAAAKILDSLVQRNLIAMRPENPGIYLYNPDIEGKNRLLQHVDAVYRKEVIRISSLIHSKASAGVRDFARAFRFKKDDKE
jgi:hypothetical protein